jgi:HAD superfamily hydrolase (TIGR01549 family)
MQSNIKAVLFDIDGTLFDRHNAQRLIFRAFKQEYASLFDGIDEYMLMAIYYEAGRLAGEYFYTDNDKNLLYLYRFQMFLTMLGREDGYAQGMADFYVDQYTKVNSEIPDAREVVKRLAKSYPIGVITNGISLGQRAKLQSLGIIPLLKCVLISEEFGIAKPDRQIFEKAAADLGLKTGDCLYIGNTFDHDIMGGLEAGMQTCWFNPKKAAPEDDKIKPDYQIEKLSELLKILL